MRAVGSHIESAVAKAGLGTQPQGFRHRQGRTAAMPQAKPCNHLQRDVRPSPACRIAPGFSRRSGHHEAILLLGRAQGMAGATL